MGGSIYSLLKVMFQRPNFVLSIMSNLVKIPPPPDIVET